MYIIFKYNKLNLLLYSYFMFCIIYIMNITMNNVLEQISLL